MMFDACKKKTVSNLAFSIPVLKYKKRIIKKKKVNSRRANILKID